MLLGSGQLRSSGFNDFTIRYLAIYPAAGADIRVLNCCDICLAVAETFMDDFIFKEFHFNTGVV
jgi:hypothetical protein